MEKVLLSIAFVTTFAFSGITQLYDQTFSPSTDGVVSAYMTDIDTLVQCADDFVVPVGQGWNINSVSVRGFRNDTGPNMDSVMVEIYSHESGPDTIIYSAIHTLAGGGVPCPQSDTTITITIPTLFLEAGTYWVSVYGYTPSVGRWNWLMHSLSMPINNAAMLQDLDMYYGIGPWTSVIGIGLPDPDFMFIVDGTASLSEIDEVEQIKLSIYPNPVIDEITINVDGSKIEQVSIYTINGQLLRSEVNPLKQIDVSDLSSGIYILEVSTADGIAQERFVKK